MAAEPKVTTDHELIRQWVTERGGTPAKVARTGDELDPGGLRINFPGAGSEETLVDMSWSEFFDLFEEEGLAFLYQDEQRSGEESTFVRFVSRNTGEG